MVKVATVHINDINKRLPNLLAWLGKAAPDIVCLQELKATDLAFPEAAIHSAGYQAAWRGQASWNVVAILSKGAAPVVTRRQLPGAQSDTQSRYIEAAVAGILVGCLYLPNGNPCPVPNSTTSLNGCSACLPTQRVSSPAACRWSWPAISMCPN